MADSEDLVEQICHKLFFRDFVVRSPRFRKPSGQELEAADILVPFLDHLISIQVKSRESRPNNQDVRAEAARIEKRIDAGVSQIKTVLRGIATRRLTTVTTSRGFEVAFDCDRQWKHIGVVVLDLLGEEALPPEQRVEIYSHVVRRRGIPIHVILRTDFLLLARELGTLPDFLEYLDVRMRLIEQERLGPFTLERDLLALHKMNHEALRKALAGELDTLVISEGIWEGYQARYAEDIRRRDRRNEASYIVDEVIDAFHKAVGYDIQNEDPIAAQDSARYAETTAEGYLELVAELASLSRVRRRTLGELILDKARRAIDRPYSYALYIDTDRNVGFVVVATNKRRGERRTILENVTTAALCSKNLSKVVGVATEAADQETRSYDGFVAVTEDLTEEGRREFSALGDQIFEPLQERKIAEFE